MKKEAKNIKNNKYVDPKGNVLTLSNITDKGKLFTTKNNLRVCLTEKQVNKLKLLNEDIYNVGYKDYKVIGLKISFDDVEDGLLITDKAIMGFNTWDSLSIDNRFIGYMCVDLSIVVLGNYTIDFLHTYAHSGTIKVMFENLDSIEYKVDFMTSFREIGKNQYICLFEGKINK